MPLYNSNGNEITNIYDVDGNVIETTGNITPLDVTENGVYNASSGVDGYNPVRVSVSSGAIFQGGVLSGYVTEPEYKTVNGDNYRLVWKDDFDGADINHNFWTDTHFISRVTNRYQAWTDHYLEDSILHLRIKRDAPNRYLSDDSNNDVAVTAIQTGEVNQLHITSPFYHDVNPFWGLIVQEGYWECRMKVFSATGGAHTSWWAVGIQDGLYTDLPRAEIDITETWASATNKLPHGVHKQTDNNVTESYTTTTVNVDFATDYHTVGFLWENGVMKWYVDGTLVDTMNINTPQYPMMIFLAAYKRRSGTGWTGAADTTLGDVEMCVDYMKIYKKATSVSSTTLTVTGQQAISIDGSTANMTIDSDRGCPICFPSYVYLNWSDGTRTEHWVKWDATKETYADNITNQTDFQWHGYVYNLGIDAYASITF